MCLSFPSAFLIEGYQVKPLYPELARQRGIEGHAHLKVRVPEQGRVETVQVERSAGHPVLDHSETEAVRSGQDCRILSPYESE
jgi:TonB family protein